MFNKKDASAEIATSMESHLVTHVIEKQAEQMNKFAKALDYLNSVAEIFDELGLRREAEVTTTLLEVVAAKKSKKKVKSKGKPKSKSKKKSPRKSKKDTATEGLTSEKMEDNLKEKGWVFNADDDFSFDDDGDFDYADDGHHDSCMCSMCMDADDDMNYGDEADEEEDRLARMFHEMRRADRIPDLDIPEDYEDQLADRPTSPAPAPESYKSNYIEELNGLFDRHKADDGWFSRRR